MPTRLSLQNVEAICFDLDDTLVQTTYFNDQSLSAVVKVLQDRRIAFGIPEAELRKLLLNIKIEYGTSYSKLFEEWGRGLGIQDEKVLTEAAVAYDKLEEASLRLFPGVTNLLRLLIGNRTKMGVVTNGDAFRQWKKLVVLGIADLFDAVVISEVAQVKKPDPKIYRIALDRLDAEPSKSVFIGDRPDLDVKGAKEGGMFTIRVLQGREAGRRPADESEVPDLELPSIEFVAPLLVSS